MKQRLIDRKYGFYSAIIVMSLAIMIYTLANRLIGGDYLFMHSDLLVQYGTFARLLLRNIFEGGSIEYSFQFSMGMPTMALYTFYSFSPFNLIYGIVNDIDMASAIIVFLKLSLAGYTFQRFLVKVFGIDHLESVLFSVFYALCGYSVVFYYNIHTLDGVYMLPVIISLMVSFVREGRFLRLLIAYAYLFIVNFYCGYIIGFFSALIWLVMVIETYQKEWRRYLVSAAKYVFSVVCAAFIGAFALLPTAFYIFGKEAEDVVFGGMQINILDFINGFFMYNHSEIEYHPVLYCGLLVLLLVPFFFMNKNIEKNRKIMAVVLLAFLTVCSLWTPGYLFMHCFDVPNGCGYRYTYFLAFVLLSMGAVTWEKIENENKSKIVITGALLMLFYVAFFFFQMRFYEEEDILVSTPGIYINAMFIIGYIIVFLAAEKIDRLKKYMTELMVIIGCIELVVNGVALVKDLEVSAGEERIVNETFANMFGDVLRDIKSHDDGIYRIYYENCFGCNDACLNDYMTLEYFSTIENPTLRNTLMKLGYYSSSRLVFDYGSTPIMRILWGQKYHVNINRREYVLSDELAPWEEELALSLGYMVSPDILNVSLDSDNAFENQNRFISGVAGRPIEGFWMYNDAIICTTNNCTVAWDGNWNVVERADESIQDASMIMQMDNSVDLPAYAYFSQEGSVLNNTSPQVVSMGGDMGTMVNHSYLSTPHILYLAKDEEGKYAAKILFNEVTLPMYGFQNVYFAYYNEAAEQELYDALKDHQLTIQRMKGNRLEGAVESTEEKNILFLSIPYDRGWHIYVDGVESDIIRAVNDTFLAVELQPGYHHIEMVYRDEAFRLGRWISLFTLIVVSICGVISTLSKREEKVG